MGFFSRPKPPSGPSPEEIRAQEQAKIEKENLALQQQQEEQRRGLRSRVTAGEEEENIARKRLLG